MPSEYLQPAEGPQYGLKTLDTNEIVQASALLDAYLKRPEGLVWQPDAGGRPCAMQALEPDLTFTLADPITPGQNVAVNLNGPTDLLQTGDVLLLELGAEKPAQAEAVVVNPITGTPGSPAITFQSVAYAHAADATAEHGLVIVEKRQMPAGRPLTMASRTPLLRVISGVGRYAYGRRGDDSNYNMEQFNLLASLQRFGGPPVWELWQPQLSNCWDPSTGQIWAPAGIMLAYYSEIRVSYIAGFPASAIPAPVKLATARLIQAMRGQTPMGNLKQIKAGDTAYSMFAADLFDQDTKRALQPFVSRVMG